MADKKNTVQKDSVVSLDYTLTLDNGQVVDSSEGREPLDYLHGHGQLIPGLERELQGMEIGEEKNVTVSAAEGYGDKDPDALQVVPLEIFPSDMELAPGMGLQLQDGSGQVMEAVVVEVRSDGVLLDFNHPLAGETLHFNVKIVDVRPATAEELAHGHAHSAGHEH
jgi:FKBP-type peptidyl-prolyl cis-trans isomerase SlyD